jgi:hypothetical protein
MMPAVGDAFIVVPNGLRGRITCVGENWLTIEGEGWRRYILLRKWPVPWLVPA